MREGDRGKGPNRFSFPDEKQAKEVHLSIYDSGYGIKAHSNPVTKEARQIVINAVRALGKLGATAVVLGCTELPIAHQSIHWTG